MSSARETFATVYRSHLWGGTSRSGPGSDPHVLHSYKRVLAKVLHDQDIRTVVDVGCGDWALGRTMDWSGFDYTGVDIVPDLITSLDAQFSNDHVRFTCLDLESDPLPKGDLCIIKDVLQHLSNDAVIRFLEALPKQFRAALITNDISHLEQGGWRALWKTNTLPPNVDIADGDYRPLALMEPPFGLRATRLLTFSLRFRRHVFGHPGIVLETKEVLLWDRDANL
jgi:SAM-dependent methyltransferase